MKKVEVVLLNNNAQQRQAHTSLMERFRDPKSSVSSEDYKSEIVWIPKIIRNPKETIIQQIIETKFMWNTGEISNLNHDSEMVDQNYLNSQAITKKESEIRVIRSDVSGDTSNRYFNNSGFSPKPPLIGKSTRSRNMQNTIKASRDSIDSQNAIINKNFGEISTTIDKTMNQTMMRTKKFKRKDMGQTKMELPQSHEELSDFETFRNLESDVSKVFKKGGLWKNISQLDFQSHPNDEGANSNSKSSDEDKNIEEEIPDIPKPKIMGFFKNSQGMSRNGGLKNIHSNSVKLGESKVESTVSLTKILPIDENEGEISNSPRFNYEHQEKNRSESTEPNILQFTDNQPSKQIRTVGEGELKISNVRRITTKAKKKNILKEALIESTRRK